MAAGTVGYTDTRGNRDYIGEIAGQIKRRVGEASDMAGRERAFAEEQAEAGGTSLSEAGIGRGYFFGRALGSRFGGDAIARTRGRFSKTPSAGTNPAGNAASRFRGGFDYNVTNEISTAGVAPLTGAVVSGLSGVETGLIAVSQSMMRIDNTLGGLERTQTDTARAIMGLGYMMAMLRSQSQRAAGRESLRREERSLEGGGVGGGSIGGSSFGGAGGGRGMINVTPTAGMGGGGGGSDGSFGFGKGYAAGGDNRGSGSGVMSALTSGLGIAGVSKGAKGFATTSMLRKGKLPKSSSLLPIANKAGRAGLMNTDKITSNLMKILGGNGAGMGSAFGKILNRAMGGGNIAKAGTEAFDSFVDPKTIQKGMAVSAADAERIASMMNLQTAGVTSKFNSELQDIITRSDKYRRYAGLHGNSLKAQSPNAVKFRKQLKIDRLAFRSLRGEMKGNRLGKRVFTDEAVENLLRLGISPGKELTSHITEGGELMFGTSTNNPIKYISGDPAKPLYTNPEPSLRIAEDLNEFFPKGLHHFKSSEDAVILTKYARELDSLKKLKNPSRKEVNLAKKNMELIFGKSRVDKAFKQSGKAAMSNTMLKKAMGKMGPGRLAKLIPGVSAVMGAYFAIDRARKGDFLGSGLELISGLAGIVPGIGTKTGMGIDAYLLARDFGIMPLESGTPHVGLEGLLGGRYGDKNLALLSSGESVLNRDATRKLGPGNIAALNLNSKNGGFFDRKSVKEQKIQNDFMTSMSTFMQGLNRTSLVNFDFSRNTDNSQNMHQNINVAQVNRILDALENGGAGETQVVQQITNNYTSPPQAETEGDSGGNSGGFSDGGLDFARLRYLSGLF